MSEFQEKQILQDENEANRFAIELLIPYKMITEDLKDIRFIDIEDEPLIKTLAEKYQVSEQLMLIRILEVKNEHFNKKN